MSIVLEELYEETKELYDLKLICGKKGLKHNVRWVYVTEDYTTAPFLSGGELVITTGVSSTHQKNWLLHLVTAMIEKNTCGLIINTGKYLKEEDITEDVRSICEQAEYPIFAMAWETHMYDITHDYYNRIFLDTEIRHTLNTAFSDLIFMPADFISTAHSLAVLKEHGYANWNCYTVCSLSICFADSVHIDNITLRLYEIIQELYPTCYILTGKNCHLLLLPIVSSDIQQKHLTDLISRYIRLYPIRELHLGIGSTVSDLTNLSVSYLHSQSAMQMAKYQGDTIFAFDDMGFFKLLLSISDRSILEKYMEEQLGDLLEYDEKHHSNYTETLYYYLKYDGSIQRIADTLFCHRNTVNYRIRFIKEELHYHLEDRQQKFQLYTAFQIKEYLNIILPAPPQDSLQ